MHAKFPFFRPRNTKKDINKPDKVLRTYTLNTIGSNITSHKALPGTKTKSGRRRRIALLLPGHNEEMIIAHTIESAVSAGQDIRDIFVVDDNSSDRTRRQALKYLPKSNVLTVERSGKALAVLKAVHHFNICDRYVWLHVADADSVFGKDYFRIYKSRLNAKKYVVAVGFVQSLRGNWISSYRALSYTYGQHMLRRIQAKFNAITVFPGPTTCFRTDILDKLVFGTDSFTEDFDLTLQVHRNRLGKILYIPEAVNFTQDPQNLRDFSIQTTRWYRGFFQGIKKYRIGQRLQLIDAVIGYQLLEAAVYFMQLFVFLPIVVWRTGNWLAIPVVFCLDYIVMGIIAAFSALAIKRPSLMGVMPYFYFLRWVELSIFIRSFVEIVVLGKYGDNASAAWDTEGRRYQLDSNAMQDAAK